MGLRKYRLGDLIEPCDVRNYEGVYSIDDVKGISTSKEFIDTKANMKVSAYLHIRLLAVANLHMLQIPQDGEVK